jgi:hypothetical protein
VDTNRQPPQLTRLFNDMLASLPPAQAELLERGTGANVLSFQYPNGSDATILVSKNASRYRLQSDSFQAMGLVLGELCRRLEAYYKEVEGPGGPNGQFLVEFKESLPVQVTCAASTMPGRSLHAVQYHMVVCIAAYCSACAWCALLVHWLLGCACLVHRYTVDVVAVST